MDSIVGDFICFAISMLLILRASSDSYYIPSNSSYFLTFPYSSIFFRSSQKGDIQVYPPPWLDMIVMISLWEYTQFSYFSLYDNDLPT